jgi:4-amino-4-deoxy-L-arabinose transferase-like glycosyltransferase
MHTPPRQHSQIRTVVQDQHRIHTREHHGNLRRHAQNLLRRSQFIPILQHTHTRPRHLSRKAVYTNPISIQRRLIDDRIQPRKRNRLIQDHQIRLLERSLHPMRKSIMHSAIPDSTDRPQGSPTSRLGAFAAAFCQFLERHEAACLAISILLMSGFSLFLSLHRPYWFDEILAMMIASQPNLHSFASAMPADANPPLMDLLIRGMIHLFGPTNVTGRIPSILAFAASCLFVYLFVRRRCGTSAAFLGMALLASEAGWRYSYEARPYALLLAFITLALLCWQHAAEPHSQRGWALFGLTLAIAGAMLTQHLGIVQLGFPILCGEAWRLHRTRRLDWPLYATFLIALPVLALTVPMMRRSQQGLSYLHAMSVNRLSLGFMLHWIAMIATSMNQILGLSVLLLAVPIYIAVQRKRRGIPVLPKLNVPATPLPQHEIAAAIGAALLIPLTAIILMPINNRYDCRYAIGTIAGLSILGAFSISKLMPARKDVYALLLLLCALIFANNVRHAYAIIRPVTFPVLIGENAQLPVVTFEPYQFYALWWYGTSSQRDRLYFIYDPQAPAEIEGVPIFERGRLPMQTETYAKFLATTPHFTALTPWPVYIQRMLQMGFQLTPIGSPNNLTYDVTKPQPPSSPAPKTAP